MGHIYRKLSKCHSREKLSGNGQMDRIFMSEFEKEIDSRGYSDPALGLYTSYMYMYMTIIVKQIGRYKSQISGEHLQDHWSSGCIKCTFYRARNHLKETS